MNRIREFRNARGWSLQKLAEAANTSKSQIDKLEKGARRLTVDWMVRLAKPLGCDPRDLLPVSPALNVKMIKPEKDSSEKRWAANGNTPHHGLIPVRGSGQKPIDQVQRPYYLTHAKDAYAIYVNETVMQPMYRPRQLLFINPYKPPSSGNGVVVIGKKGDVRVREFVKAGLKTVAVREYHPKKREVSIALKDIAGVHTIVGTVEP